MSSIFENYFRFFDKYLWYINANFLPISGRFNLFAPNMADLVHLPPCSIWDSSLLCGEFLMVAPKSRPKSKNSIMTGSVCLNSGHWLAHEVCHDSILDLKPHSGCCDVIKLGNTSLNFGGKTIKSSIVAFMFDIQWKFL